MTSTCSLPHSGEPEMVQRVPSVRYYPPIDFSGQPTLEGHGLNAESIASYAWHFGVPYTMETYVLRREEVLVCCWWAGAYGTRTWRKRWGEWAATVAMPHLWHSCIAFDDPPREEAKR